MVRRLPSLSGPLLAIAALAAVSPAFAQLTADQARRIEAAVPTGVDIVPPTRRRVLIWNTPFMDQCPHKGYSVPQGEHAMRLLGERTGAFEPVVSDDVAMFAPDTLAGFDAVIMNNSNGPWIRPTEKDLPRLAGLGDTVDEVEKALRQSFLGRVREGMGIVAYHHAIGGNTHWPEFGALLGAGYGGHPWNGDVGIRVEDTGHALTRRFREPTFRIEDEIFQFREPYSRENLRILLRLDPESTDMNVPWIDREDGDFALAWVRLHGRGRVFYSAIGHRTEIWWNPDILAFYLDGIRFVLGDLKAETTPSGAESGTGLPRAFRPIFDGKTLAGWHGDRRFWSVEDGTITGRSTAESPVPENTFLLFERPLANFELRLRFKLEGGNSGIYFRSVERTGNTGEALVGPQADFSADNRWTGVLMEYTGRGILAERGERVTIHPDGSREVTGSVGDPADLLARVRDGEWNDYTLIADGETVILRINGFTMCDVRDRDPRRVPEGRLAVQLHTGPPMTVRFKDIRLSIRP